MTISMEKQYTTRAGRPVRLLCVDGPGNEPIFGLIGEQVYRWFADGSNRHQKDDLIEAKPRVQCEAWVYREIGGGYHLTAARYEDESAPPVARVNIDVEEGHGLEGALRHGNAPL